MSRINIGVFGSCVSRDMFNHTINPGYKDFFSITFSHVNDSILSIMEKKIPFNEEDIRILPDNKSNKSDTNFIRQTLVKNFFENLNKTKIDYLLIDFYLDIKWGAISFEDYVIYNNPSLKKTAFYNNIQDKHLINCQQTYHEYLKLFKEKFDTFYNKMSEEYPDISLIINPVLENYKLLYEDNNIVEVESYKKDNDNKYLISVYKFIAKNYDLEFLNNDKTYYLDPHHQWGQQPVHFVREYYTETSKQIRDIAKRDSILKDKYDFLCDNIRKNTINNYLLRIQKQELEYQILNSKKMNESYNNLFNSNELSVNNLNSKLRETNKDILLNNNKFYNTSELDYITDNNDNLISDDIDEIRQHFDENYIHCYDKTLFLNSYYSKKEYLSKKDIGYNYFVVPDKTVTFEDVLSINFSKPKRIIKDVPEINDLNFISKEDYLSNNNHFTSEALLNIFSNILETMYGNSVVYYKNLIEDHLQFEKDENKEFVEKLVDCDNYKVMDIPTCLEKVGVNPSKHYINKQSISNQKILILTENHFNQILPLFVSYFREVFVYPDQGYFNKNVFNFIDFDEVIELHYEKSLESLNYPILNENRNTLVPHGIQIDKCQIISKKLIIELLVNNLYNEKVKCDCEIYLNDNLIKKISIHGPYQLEYDLKDDNSSEFKIDIVVSGIPNVNIMERSQVIKNP